MVHIHRINEAEGRLSWKRRKTSEEGQGPREGNGGECDQKIPCTYLEKVNRTYHWTCVSAERSVSKDSYRGPLSDFFFISREEEIKDVLESSLTELISWISVGAYPQLCSSVWYQGKLQPITDCFLVDSRNWNLNWDSFFLFKCRCDLPPEGERIIFWMKY